MERMQQVTRVGVVGIIGNIFLMLIKMVSGIIFSSQAMIADAVNSFMDIFASFMTMAGGHIATQPRDDGHQFGHGKAEFLFSLFVSLSMIVGAILIFIDALQGFFEGHAVTFSILLLAVCLITILVKFFMYLFARKVFYATESLLVYSNMIDHRNDMVITSFTFLSVCLSFFGFSFFDSIVGIGISCWIGYSGLQIFLDSCRILMDQSLQDVDSKKIQDFILKQSGIEGITKFETTPCGYQYILILSILVDGNLKTFESHEIADRLEKAILKEFPEIMTATIHVNPTVLSSKKKKEKKKKKLS